MREIDLQDYEPNVLCGKLVAAALYKLGIESVGTSPGSRSTPLTFAFARHSGLKTYSILDERSAAFFAVGIAKRIRKPVVLVCTSGSATGNYLPAIMEAHHSHTPLLVLTADRPPELRDCQSGQTVNQAGLYSNFVRFEAEVAVPKATESYLRYLRQLLLNAVSHSAEQGGGVVHLNMPFEDPLAPSTPIFNEAKLDQTVGQIVKGIATTKSENKSEWKPFLERIDTAERALVIAGPDNTYSRDSFADAVSALVNRLKFPVIADSLSSVRNQGYLETYIDQFEVILRSDSYVDSLRPDLILWLGDFPTSKTLRTAMAKWDCEMIHFSETSENRDPTHSQTSKCYTSYSQLAATIANLSETLKASVFTQKWLQLNQSANTRLNPPLKAETSIELEPLISHNLADSINAPADLFISNSTPIRDMDFFWRGSEHVQKVFTNRGANGIDGIISTALGATRPEIPMIVLLGELSLFYDVGGLASLRSPRFEGRIVFIVQDNEGGGIFEHLPISEWEHPFEPYFTTPQSVDMQSLCQAYGVTYQPVASFEGLKDSLNTFLNESQAMALCLHIRTDRKRSAKFRAEVLNNAASQISLDE